MTTMKSSGLLVAGTGLALAMSFSSAGAAGWKPSQPVEIIVPAGSGGGADKMARLIGKIVNERRLTPHPITVVNRPGNSGAEGFLEMKQNRGNPHKLVVTLSNLFTTPIATGVQFSWRDLTPISMLALDQFVLWVPADSPYPSVDEYLKAVKAAPRKFRMGGTGSKQEDEIITRAIEQEIRGSFTYVPLGGGGEVAKQLADRQLDSSVNNPAEAVELWRAGRLRPLAVFDTQRLPLREKVTATMSWNDIPTMKEFGYDVEYLMLRGIFAAPGIPDEAQDYYIQLMQAVTETPEWKDYLKKGALKPRFLTKELFRSWLQFAEATHKMLMAAR